MNTNSVGVNAFAGKNNTVSLIAQIDAWLTNKFTDLASWFYLYDGTFNCEGNIYSLVNNPTTGEGVKSATMLGRGNYFGGGQAVFTKLDVSQDATGKQLLSVTVTDAVSKEVLYNATNLSIIQGSFLIDFPDAASVQPDSNV